MVIRLMGTGWFKPAYGVMGHPYLIMLSTQDQGTPKRP